MKNPFFRPVRLFVMTLGTLLLLASCASTKSLNSGLRNSTASLYYGSNTLPYNGVRPEVVFLRDVSAANMDFRSEVKHRSSLVLPFVWYNYVGHRYNVRLGEQSLKDGYRPFFIDALIAESDYSGNYRMETAIPDSIVSRVYTLDVRFDSISTCGNLTYRNHTILLCFLDDGGDFFANINDYRLRGLRTGISATITLTQGDEVVLERRYELVCPVSLRLVYPADGWLCDRVTSDMAGALSEATSQLISSMVSDITQTIATRDGVAWPIRAVGE